MIADHELYAHSVLELIKNSFPVIKPLAIELGPGEGEFLATLCDCFKQVIAVDNSEEMLQQARYASQISKLKNIHFIHGEIGDLDLTSQADCIVANMVLHHVPAPAAIFRECARLLKPGGSLLFSELSQHDQEWVRESCGDLWLGFSAEELTGWARESGLECGESQYQALRNGFQIQIRRFYRPL